MDGHCFLNFSGGVIIALILPILILITFNILFLIIAAVRLWQTRFSNDAIQDREIIKSAFITGLIMTPVLGFPWLILIFNISNQYSAIELIFFVYNSMVGIVFFFVVVLRNKEIQAILRKKKPAIDSIDSNKHPPNSQPPLYLDIFGSAPISVYNRSIITEFNTQERSDEIESESGSVSNGMLMCEQTCSVEIT